MFSCILLPENAVNNATGNQEVGEREDQDPEISPRVFHYSPKNDFESLRNYSV